MRDMEDKIAVFMLIIGASVSAIVTGIITRSALNNAWRKEAIDNGAAEMVVKDNYSREATFQWKKPANYKADWNPYVVHSNVTVWLSTNKDGFIFTNYMYFYPNPMLFKSSNHSYELSH